MIKRSMKSKAVPLEIVGSSTYGRDPKISLATTINMFVSDEALVDYAGYKRIPIESLGSTGRAIYTSNILNQLICIFSSSVYRVNISYNPSTGNYQTIPFLIGTIGTTIGKCYITENNTGQILISDGSSMYVYNTTSAPPFQQVTGINFIPGQVTFQNTRFLCAAQEDATYTPNANNTWRLSNENDGLTWPEDAQHVGLIETKPDRTVGVVRFPSRGNLLLVFGQNVAEPWTDIGAQLFPYQKNTSFNVDYGCLNPATIAANDDVVAWLGQNELSGPVIMVSHGGTPKPISTDGIDFKLSNLINPSSAEGFIYKQDGHLFYHINFIEDNFSLFYDFNTEKFFDAMDENNNASIISQVAFLDNQYYFISRTNGNLYALDTIYPDFDGAVAPRIRICPPIRMQDQADFIVTDVGFTVDQGNTDPIMQEINGVNTPTYPRVDFSISIDGGQSFGSSEGYQLNGIGHKQNMLRWWQCGMANDFTAQFRFWGFNRVVAFNGQANVRVAS